jgi:hypothetical protein
MTEALTSDNLLHFNGIDGDTGDYALPPMPPADLARLIRGEAGPENLTELRDKERNKDPKHLGVREGVDPKNLAETGWGIVFPQDADPAIREALSPLLALREGQAGERFRIYAGEDGYQTGETKSHWLARRPRKMGPGPADPRRVPYYLLICASPEEIPDRFQSQLDVQYAVGRIHFDDLDGYANYARSVVEAETGGLRLPRRMEVFGVANPMDQATHLSAKHLVAPVRDELAEDFADWSFTASMREQATKARLAELLGGADTPALLFTASHGMGFGPDSAPAAAPGGAAVPGLAWARHASGADPAGLLLRRRRPRRGRQPARPDRLLLRLLRRRHARAGRVCPAGLPAAEPHQPTSVHGPAADADARPAPRRRAGGDRPCGSGLELFVSLAGRGTADRRLPRCLPPAARRPPGGLGAGALRCPLRRAVHAAQRRPATGRPRPVSSIPEISPASGPPTTTPAAMP